MFAFIINCLSIHLNQSNLISSSKLDPDPYQAPSWIQIQIKLKAGSRSISSSKLDPNPYQATKWIQFHIML